jgi:hypothetical protein
MIRQRQRLGPMLAFAFSALFSAQAALSAQTESAPSVMPDARVSALGGKHVAQSDGLSLLFSNPACFATAPGEFIVTGLSAQLSGPVFDIAGLLIKGQQMSTMAVAGLMDPDGRLYTALDSGGPLAVGYVGKGLGLGLFNRSWATVNASSLMTVDIDAAEELLAIAGYGYRIKLSPALALDLGLSTKFFVRLEMPYPTSVLGLSAFMQDYASIFKRTGYRATTGLGLDAGMRFSILDRYAFAVAARDAYTPTFIASIPSLEAFSADPFQIFTNASGTGIVPCNLAAGIYLDPPLGFMSRYLSSWRFMLDYDDILSLFDTQPPNPFLLASAGTELTIHDVLHLRGGWNQGSPAAGFGLDLTAFDLEVAMFGKELGYDLGERTVYNLLISVNMKLR